MTAVLNAGLAGISDSSVDDIDEEALAALRNIGREREVIIRPATAEDTWRIVGIYWSHWLSIHSGIPASAFEEARNGRGRVPWGNEYDRLVRPLHDELLETIASGHGAVADNGGEILGFMTVDVPHWGVMEGTHLFVKHSARNFGFAARLLEYGTDLAAERGFRTFVGANSPHYFSGKSFAAAHRYLELSAGGWVITPNLDSMLFQFPIARTNNRYYEPPQEKMRLYVIDPYFGDARVDMATEANAYEISQMSRAIPGVQTLSQQQVQKLLEQGPACIVTGRGIFGYALSKMSVPGVVEIAALALNDASKSQDTEAQLLSYIHKRGRFYNQDVTILVDAPGPRRVYTPSFRPVLTELGYIEHLRLGHNEDVPVLGRAIWHDDFARRSSPQRFSPVWESSVRLREEYFADQKPGGFRYLMDEGERDGRDPAAVGFTGAIPLSLGDERLAGRGSGIALEPMPRLLMGL